MKSKFLPLIPAAALLAVFPALANAGVIAVAPVLSQPVPGAGGIDFAADVLLPADVNTAMVGYDVAFTITGPAGGVTITGADILNHPANSVFASDPIFSTHVVAPSITVYAFSDFLIAGTGTITTDSVLLRLKFHADAGTTGVYNVNFVTDAASVYKSVLYANAGLTPVPVTFQSGSITFSAAPIPEPASLTLVSASGLLLLRRARRKP